MNAEDFLSQYDEAVFTRALELRQLVLLHLPGVTEQVDLPAKMVMYVYGPRYKDLVCNIIPSKNGLKLGFYKGNELPDPGRLLEGTGKISRYLVVDPGKKMNVAGIEKLLQAALLACRQRNGE